LETAGGEGAGVFFPATTCFEDGGGIDEEFGFLAAYAAELSCVDVGAGDCGMVFGFLGLPGFGGGG
jgi:hypothetical protein|tara:strand:+ start:275 stop:472 length:198 start_codon:yes stop_codon:yes gene_type:complete